MKDWSYNPNDPDAFKGKEGKSKSKGKKRRYTRKKREKATSVSAKAAYRERSKKFFDSREWKEVRYQALRHYGGSCLLCGAKASDGAKLHVDHIKPRSRYPHLALSLGNIQVLCADCNIGKGSRYEDDWRY